MRYNVSGRPLMTQSPEDKTNAFLPLPDEGKGFIRRHRRSVLYVLVILAVSAFLVYLQLNLSFFEKFMPVGDNKALIVILNLNLLIILYLIFYVIRTLFKTYIEKKRGIWGSGLKTKLTVTVFSISIISTAALFVITTWFFYTSMDKWFSSKVEDVIDNARELSVLYYEDLFGRYQKMGVSLGMTIEQEDLLADTEGLAAFTRKQAKTHFIDMLAVVNLQGQTIESYVGLKGEAKRTAHQKAKALIEKNQPEGVVGLGDGELVVSKTPLHDKAGHIVGFLLIGERIAVKSTKNIERISRTYVDFRKSRPLKKIIKYSFFIPLFLVTMLSIVFSVWIGRKMATEIAVPLERVKEGAAIIAAGRFDINLEDRGKDEIGTLVGAFNRMARELKTAKDEIEEKRRYMEVILDNVTTGIISTDVRGNVLLLNRAAKDILKIETDDWAGAALRSVLGEDFKKIIRPFLKVIRQEAAGDGVQEMLISLQNGTLHVRASLTVLKDENKIAEGYIVTFDDITHIMKAEKLATWREIAKRLTHEIKNPLTPIRLSAERLRRKILPAVTEKEKEVIDETTSIILSSTSDITIMVNELNKLTHISANRSVEDINEVIEETIDVYKNLNPNISFQFEQGQAPAFRMDRGNLKRAFINLFTNSIKAIGAGEGSIVTSTHYDNLRGILRIEVADTGPGIKDENKNRVFDPYVTSNDDGTGLGLAIVHSIVLEHNGRIHVEDNVPRGARMVIELPLVFESET
jgi:two-component system, NtrC family, nitrogen regulation sensor histidine kinase NtrY